MTLIKTNHNRRSFLKVSAATGGGILLGFNFFAGCKPAVEQVVAKAIPKEWFNINAFLKIGDTGLVTIFSPNPEIGQNVKTSMPMIVAEELDVAWRDVVVEQSGLDTDVFSRQVAGGSQSINKGWDSLRMAGATARAMLIAAAAQQWGVEPGECTTSEGVISNAKGETITYAAIAAAAAKMEVPEEVALKDPKDFKIIGTDTRNVDGDKIITGASLFGLDYKVEGMKYAVLIRPPSFGMKLTSFDATAAKAINGVEEVYQIQQVNRFENKVDKIAVVANSTWAAMKGKKAVVANWERDTSLESSEDHDAKMKALLDTPAKEARRKDGDVKKAFAEADNVIERMYESPFLPHNCLEPMNFFAHVTAEKVHMVGPIQTPEWTRNRIAGLLERDVSEVQIDMTRMGGGFGRRLYGDFALEAAELSKVSGQPIKVVFSREDDMTAGTYKPAFKYKFRASVKGGAITGYHMTEVGVQSEMWDPMPNNFPAGAIPNFLVESHKMDSNITTGAWRAPIANFLAYAEQAFFDELAQEMGKDAVQLRLELLDKAAKNPVGEKGNYEIDKLRGVIELAAEKSNWSKAGEGVFQGFSVYFSHDTYVAEVANVKMKANQPVVQKVICAIDCGIVVNPIAALNQVEGGVIDGIGHAMYGEMTFEDGQPQQNNFNNYRLIRMGETPVIETHFVKSFNHPTGLGEPTLPPAGGAIANAIHSATKKRMYKQPFVGNSEMLG